MVNEAKKAYIEAKKAVEPLKTKQSELLKRLDDTRESLPVLQRKIAEKRGDQQRTYDKVILGDEKESALKVCVEGLEQVEKEYAEAQQVFDALVRETKIIEAGIPRKINEAELLKRNLWESIFNEIKTSIPPHTFDALKNLLVAGAQCCKSRQFILDNLFPNLSSGEHQEIYKELTKKYGIVD